MGVQYSSSIPAYERWLGFLARHDTMRVVVDVGPTAAATLTVDAARWRHLDSPHHLMLDAKSQEVVYIGEQRYDDAVDVICARAECCPQAAGALLVLKGLW